MGDEIGQDKVLGHKVEIDQNFGTVVVGTNEQHFHIEAAQTSVYAAGRTVKPPVFISYASEDRGEVEKLVKYLEADYTVWFDRKDIAAGEHWLRQINLGIARCSVMLAVISDKARTKIADPERGKVIRHEQTEALRLFRPLIPVLLQGESLPDYYPPDTQQIRTTTAGSIEPVLAQVAAEIQRQALRSGPFLIDQSPTAARPFVGREAELKEIHALMRGDDSLVITSQQAAAVQGQGGIGKTMVAGEVLRRLAPRYPGGVLLAEFGPPPRDAEGKAQPREKDLAAEIMRGWAQLALGAQYEPAHSYSTAELRGHLANYGKLLVLLDDVWSSDHAALRTVLEALPPDADRLVTTRFRAVSDAVGGHLYALGKLTQADGLKLLRERLGHKPGPLPGEAALIEAWAAVDGHALSLELLAGRLQRCSDLGAEVQALRAALAGGEGLKEIALLLPEESRTAQTSLLASLQLSYQALDPTMQGAFRAMGVLAPLASFDRGVLAALWGLPDEEAARKIADRLGAAGLLGEAEAGLEGRVRHSQHMTLRAYARALLASPLSPAAGAAGEGPGEGVGAAARRHAEYYARLAREHWDPNKARRLFEEFEQLEAAFGFAREARDPDLLYRLTWHTRNAFRLAGRWAQGAQWLQAALDAQVGEDRETVQRKAYLHSGLADYASSRGDWPEAERLLRIKVELSRIIDDRDGIAVGQGKLADLAANRGDWAEAERLNREALAVFEALGDRQQAAVSKGSLASLAANRGQWAEAERLNREALAVFEALGDRRTIAVSKGKLADLAAKRGDWAEAERLFTEALAVMEELKDRRSIAVYKGKLADLAAQRGDWAEAERLYREALETYRQLGDRVSEAVDSYNLARHLRGRGRLEEAIALMERVVELRRATNHPNLSRYTDLLEEFRAEKRGR